MERCLGDKPCEYIGLACGCFPGERHPRGYLGSLGCHGEAPFRVHGESSTRLRRLDIKEGGMPASVPIKLIQIEDGEFDAFGKDPREGARAEAVPMPERRRQS
jgi:hypothetical protein